MLNPPGFMFCGRCGNKLTSSPSSALEDLGSAQTVYVNAADQGFPTRPPIEPEVQKSAPTGAPPTPTPAPTANVGGGPAARLVMLGPDGQPIGERILAAGEVLEIGRDMGPPWDDDAYLDPRHAALTPTADGILVEDFGALNGVFLKLTERMEIQHGDQFRVGQELLLYEDLPEPTPTEDGTEKMGSPNPGYWGRISVLVDPDRPSGAFPIASEGIGIGREHGEITFPTDGYVSGHHCRIFGDDEGIYIEDVGSSNGTYMRVRNGQVVPYGSLVLIGQKLFQLEMAD